MAGKYEKEISPKKSRRKRRKKRSGILLCILIPLLCAGIFGAWMISQLPALRYIGKKLPEYPDTRIEQQTEPSEELLQTAPQETEPVTKVATATIGATGDILLHDLVIKSGYDEETDSYNFDNIFKWFSKYVSQMDYAAANLEGTLAGEDNGYPYSGYPSFNAPDEIVDAAKAAGFDLLLTANNHAFDTGLKGFNRTVKAIDERGVDHIGTRLQKDDKSYIVRDINGIKVGMTCYTYCSGYNTAGNFKLNNISLPESASKRVNAFHYKDLEKFYNNLGGQLQEMNIDGAEVRVVFIHWGTEYKTVPNESQKKIAQRLCDLGVDVIVGNHAHVAQPVELLTSSTFAAHKTLCIYSTGNTVSNIYRSKNFPAHTEDGMLFQFTLAKYSDGTVLVERADVLPTWVHRYDDEQGVRKFQILTLEEGADWKTDMNLTDELLKECEDSYNRTMEIVGKGLDEANAWFAQKQEDKEIEAGIR